MNDPTFCRRFSLLAVFAKSAIKFLKLSSCFSRTELYFYSEQKTNMLSSGRHGRRQKACTGNNRRHPGVAASEECGRIERHEGDPQIIIHAFVRHHLGGENPPEDRHPVRGTVTGLIKIYETPRPEQERHSRSKRHLRREVVSLCFRSGLRSWRPQSSGCGLRAEGLELRMTKRLTPAVEVRPR